MSSDTLGLAAMMSCVYLERQTFEGFTEIIRTWICMLIKYLQCSGKFLGPMWALWPLCNGVCLRMHINTLLWVCKSKDKCCWNGENKGTLLEKCRALLGSARRISLDFDDYKFQCKYIRVQTFLHCMHFKPVLIRKCHLGCVCACVSSI